MGMLKWEARCLTAGIPSCCPRPLGRSGWQTTSSRLWPAPTNASRVGIANCGVPQKTRSIIHLSYFTTAYFSAGWQRGFLPLTRFGQLAHLALDQVALERADVADE